MCGRFVFVWSVTARSLGFQKPHIRLICPILPTLVFRFMSPQQCTTAQMDKITHSVAMGQQTIILTDSCVCYLWAQTVSSLGYVIVCLGGLRLSVNTHTHPHTCAHTAYKWCLHLPTRPQLLWWQIIAVMGHVRQVAVTGQTVHIKYKEQRKISLFSISG